MHTTLSSLVNSYFAGLLSPITPLAISFSPDCDPHETHTLTGSECGPGAVSYHDARVQQVVWANEKVRLKKLQPMPSMEDLLRQPFGMFLVEFRWRKGFTLSDWHVAAVNCDRRCIMDNTLGIIPFTGTGTLLLYRQCPSVAYP